MRRQTRMSALFRTGRVARTMSCPIRRAHQVPGIASPATASARNRMGPWPLADNTTIADKVESPLGRQEIVLHRLLFVPREHLLDLASECSHPRDVGRPHTPWTIVVLLDSDTASDRDVPELIIAVVTRESQGRRCVNARRIEDHGRVVEGQECHSLVLMARSQLPHCLHPVKRVSMILHSKRYGRSPHGFCGRPNRRWRHSTFRCGTERLARIIHEDASKTSSGARS